MTIHIERAAHNDAETLVEVQIAAFENDALLYPGVEPGGPPGYDSLAVMHEKIARHLTYRIKLDDKIVGGIVLFDKGDHYHLDVLFIHPAFQNKGIGAAAMRFLDIAYPVARWTLDTPAYATRNHHFYEKFGYIKVGEFEEESSGLRLYAYEKKP